MSGILLNLNSQAADASASGFTDIVGLFGSATVGAADSVILLIATMPQRMTGTADAGFDMRFEVDGVLVGPEIAYFKDNVDEGCGASICYALTLSAASHDFAVQWRTKASTANALEDRERTFQVIEITDATILADTGDITSSASATSGFNDVTGMTVTPTVTTGAIHLILANMTPDDSGGDATVTYRLAIDDAGVGPEQPIFVDSSNDVCGTSIMWMVNGLTGSTKFALQWAETQVAVIADTTRVRRLQVIEITANANLPFTPVLTTAAQALTAGYGDLTDLTSGAFTIDSVDSILLFAASVSPSTASDNVAFCRFYDGSTGEGPEMHVFGDSSTAEECCGHGLFWAATGKTGSHTFTVRGDETHGSVNMGDWNSSFAILELTDPGGGGGGPSTPIAAYHHFHHNLV